MNALTDAERQQLAVDFCGLQLATPLVLLSGCVGFGEEYTRVEGFNTAREVVQLAHDFKVDMPISQQVYRVLHEGLTPEAAVHNLLGRDIRREF